MTNEKAIQLLHRLSDEQFDGIHGDERREALEMAVRALESNLVKESGDLVQDLVKDCISRKQAIEAFEPTHYTDWYTPTIIETLETLPPVRPEVLACGNGELVQESDGLVKELVKDCISRQQAIDALDKHIDTFDAIVDALDKHIDTFDAIDTNYLCGLRTAMSILKEMPSAQPETHEKRTETHACDLISREVAIGAIEEMQMPIMRSKWESDQFKFSALAEVREMISELPSAQPERSEQSESAKEYCAECNHIEMCRWYPYEGCEFRSLPSAQPQWTPCSERLPEEFGEYLVTKKTTGWNCEEYNSNDIAYFDNEGFHKADKVLAWMPLPKPYGGESDG